LQGTIYTPLSAAEAIESIELNGTASVCYTGASSIEDVNPTLLERFSAVLLRRCPFGPDQLVALPNLKCVLRMGAGYDNIDTDACVAAGVVACNCPDAWVEEVADSALSLMLAIVRHSFALNSFVSSGGGWTRQAALPSRGIRRIRGGFPLIPRTVSCASSNPL
jgi:phosphoglycerate dehydrogenase-like enzyme